MNAYDYLASSTHVDFQIQKTGSAKPAKLIAEQIQNLYSLYKSKPRFGPESCEDSINFMSHLRPIEQFFDSIDRSFMKTLENFGPQAESGPIGMASGGRDILVSVTDAGYVKLGDGSNRDCTDDSENDIDKFEADLNGYKSKLKNYINEQPLAMDNDVIYSSGECH